MEGLEETNIAKLRNQLGPLYALAQIVTLSADRPDDVEMRRIVLETAELALKNNENIKTLLTKIEEEIENGTKPNKDKQEDL